MDRLEGSEIGRLLRFKGSSRLEVKDDLTEKILGQKICKYEQCSNWENRPLKKSQLHYAALDAIVCVSIFKVLYNNS
jgi:ribonuclease D